MAILSQPALRQAETLSRFGYTNPFLSDRIELERQVLGRRYVDASSWVQYRPELSIDSMFPNAVALRQRAEELLEQMRAKLVAGCGASEHELCVYQDLAMYVLYARYMSQVSNLPVTRFGYRPQKQIQDSYDEYSKCFQRYLAIGEQRWPQPLDADTVFAGLFQIERAFFHVFRYIIGSTLEAARLRAAIWQSIFTHDMRRYSRGLYRVMGGIPTLITGPSGTGKELVARAIAYSQFIEFDAKARRFVADYTSCFHGLNLSALPAELIESELFGHVKGSFTGASRDHAGFLDDNVCGRWGAVFLDEIGELDTRIQVKLLRVLQEREFQRVGDATIRQFTGKLVAATNRDLAREMENGNFREDFYYRLCADRIATPSLRSQLQSNADELISFVRFIARQLLEGMEDEVERLTADSVAWIHQHLGHDYAWPGNIRELEQCVRSVMIRGTYSPPSRTDHGESQGKTSIHRFLGDVESGRLNSEELIDAYYKLVFTKSGSFREAARRLGVDWRTVQRHVIGDGSHGGTEITEKGQ